MRRLLLVSAVILGASPVHDAAEREHLLFARIGPASAQLFIANGDGTAERPVLPATGLDYSPSLTSDGQWIVFTSERNGSADIYRVRTDGAGLEQLTNDAAYDDQAAASPDGGTIAFVSTRAHGKTNIFLLDVASRRTRALTPGAGSDFRPSWSPDGAWIAFTSDRGTSPSRVPGQWEHLHSTSLYVVRKDGSDLRALTRGRGVTGTPRWSADGKRIYFYETTEVGSWFAQRGDAARGTTHIVSIEVATGIHKQHTTGDGVRLWPQSLADGTLAYLEKFAAGETQLRLVNNRNESTTGPRGQLRNPSWSADGARVVYHKVINGTFEMGPAYSRDPGIELTRMRLGNFPAYSPEGDRIAAGVNVPTRVLALMKADGSQRTTLFQREGATAFAPAWSPDGKQIAFSLGTYFRAQGRPRAEVALINPDGTGFRSLTPDDANNGFPSWSPDGRRIVFKKDGHLAILTLATSVVTTLTEPGPQHDNFPQWSPKGDWIAFTSDRDGTEDFRLYLIRPDGTGLRKLTDSPGDAHSIWSPDGAWVVFSSARMGFKDERTLAEAIPQPYGELFMIRPDGSGLRQLTDNQWEDATPAWRPQPAERKVTIAR
jgi:TolB protein